MIRRIRENERFYKWWVLYTVALGIFLVGVDSSILLSCFPRLAKAFHVESSVIVWINISYLILSQSLMLTFARAGDALGRKRLYLAGLACYSAGILICTLSQNITHLIIGRSIQGMGAATGFSLSMAMAVAVFPPSEQGKALGVLTAARSLGLVIGPVLGGFILDALGWRGIFYVRLPAALAALVMALLIIEEQKDEGAQYRPDLWGSASLFCWLSLILLFFNFGAKWGFGQGRSVALGLLAAVFFVLFVFAENRSAQPVINLTFFRNRLFCAATASAAFQGVTSMTVLFLIPFYLILGLGHSASVVGLLISVVAIPQVFIAPISGKLSDRFGSRMLATAGMGVMFASVWVMRDFGTAPSIAQIVAGLGLLGAGLGIFQPPNNNAIMSSVPRGALGTASAIASTATQLGLSAGFAFTGAIFANRQQVHEALLSGQGIMAPWLLEKLALIGGFRDTLLVAVAFSAAGVLTSFVRKQERPD